MWYNIHDATLVWITWKTLTHKLFKVFCCYPKYILFVDFRSIKSIYAMVKNSFVCILNYVSGFCAKKHKYTHTETQFTQHEASLDIKGVLSQLIDCTLRLDTPNYILFIRFSSERFLLPSVHQNHLSSPLWDNRCNYIWLQNVSKGNYKLQIKCRIILICRCTPTT